MATTPGGPQPGPPRFLITSPERNPYVVTPREPPPKHPVEGSSGYYIADTGPLLNFGVVPERFQLLKLHFGNRLRIPSRVAEELDRLSRDGLTAVGRAAAEAMRQLSGGFPIVDTLTNSEASFAEDELMRQLLVMPPQLAAQPSDGQHSGECHAAALAISRYDPSSTILLTNDARALRLCHTRSVAARNLRGILRELSAAHPDDYTPTMAWEDYQAMTGVSRVSNAQAASGPQDFKP